MIISAWFMIISIGSTSSVAVGEQSTYLMFSLLNPDIKIYLISLLALVSLTDISGYFIGKNFGEKKLCKNISPNKTLEGTLLGLIIPSVLFLLFGYLSIELKITGSEVFSKFLVISLFIDSFGYLITFLIIMISSSASIFGDLLASKSKRLMGIKDYGNLLPGHGGILDRIDSHIICIPVFFIFYSLI